jgi:hypothetical protein
MTTPSEATDPKADTTPPARKMDPLSLAIAAIAVTAVVLIHTLVPAAERQQATDALVVVLSITTIAAAVRGSALPGGSLAGLATLVADFLTRRSSTPPASPRRVPPTKKDGYADVLALAVLSSLFAFVAFACSGCGAASSEQRSAYAIEQARCIANERAIVDRVSTEEEDRRDLAAERARCDAALDAIYEEPGK